MFLVTIAYPNATHNRTETFAGEVENGNNVDEGKAYQFFRELVDEAHNDGKLYSALYLYEIVEPDGHLRWMRTWKRNVGSVGFRNSLNPAITATDAQIEEAFEAAGHGIVVDSEDADAIAVTRDTLDDFARLIRRGGSLPLRRKYAGFAAVSGTLNRGRNTIVAIDFGEVRAVYFEMGRSKTC